MIAFVISFIAWRNNFFKLPNEEYWLNQISGLYVILAFVFFLFIGIFLVPTLFESLRVFEQPLDDENALRVIKNGWQNIVTSALNLIAFTYLLSRLSEKERLAVFGNKALGVSWLNKINVYFEGSFSWIIVYPWIIFVGQFISIIVSFFYQGPEINQVAVDHVKKIISYPVLFLVTAAFIVTVIPLIEELLFRGFLQSWIKGLFGTKFAIMITSVMFAFFHFSTSQGIENIELVISLFVLSCFLGFLKEKFSSIWASVGLHSTFNLISILMIYKG